MNPIFTRLLIFFILTGLSLNTYGRTLPEAEQNKTKHTKDRPLKILTLGDSNGALPYGWVHQLKMIMPGDSIFNISISGNTIGFNNLGRTSLNTLSNIGTYMGKAHNQLGKIDAVIIMLGTNDCKAVFKDSLSFVPGNMRKLIVEIKNAARLHRGKPVILIVTPPPFGSDDMLEEKYKGGLERIAWLNKELLKVADAEKTYSINSFNILLPVFRNLTTDGVH
ncbi:MAG: GDSL-type esterase/lipase family protein [Bacteroidales bacterium]|nr:GDSL-type esterase/lipase family protein [Bacteroidales bacterium]